MKGEMVEGRPLNERELIERAADGDDGAFGQLVKEHQEMALRVAYLVVRDESEAEDVAQEAFIKAHRAGRWSVPVSHRSDHI